jgi:hypothetical protein
MEFEGFKGIAIAGNGVDNELTVEIQITQQNIERSPKLRTEKELLLFSVDADQ